MRDLTKYTLDGKKMGKGPLVLALVKRYAAEHPNITFEGLRAVFPDRLQAESPVQFDAVRCVVSRRADVPEKSLKRFFHRPGMQVQLADGTALVSREWNQHNIRNVLTVAEALGYCVTMEQAPNELREPLLLPSALATSEASPSRPQPSAA